MAPCGCQSRLSALNMSTSPVNDRTSSRTASPVELITVGKKRKHTTHKPVSFIFALCNTVKGTQLSIENKTLHLNVFVLKSYKVQNDNASLGKKGKTRDVRTHKRTLSNHMPPSCPHDILFIFRLSYEAGQGSHASSTSRRGNLSQGSFAVSNCITSQP